MEHRDTTLDELRNRIAEGRYEVDPVVVANAIIRRRSDIASAQEALHRSPDGPPRRRRGAVRRIGRRRPSRPAQQLAA